MLVSAIILISAALVAYTTGIWAEKFAGRLKPWHAAAFGLGLLFDATGTYVMKVIAESQGMRTQGLGGGLNVVMATTGALALVLMAAHALWAVVVLVRNRESELRTFHKFSIVVWAIWLVPYVTGMAAAMV